jgi:Tol biopolymer transport system component/DNA-binding winged helix-turn-helix (wHTH) protein
MMASSSGPERVRFDDFEANLRTGELHRSGRKVRLPNQSFNVLALLLGRAGQLVTREELRARLWPNGTFVEYDQSLNAAVNRLREALRDSADKPRYIETLPKRGYRFIAALEVEVAPLPPSTTTAPSTAVAPTPPVLPSHSTDPTSSDSGRDVVAAPPATSESASANRDSAAGTSARWRAKRGWAIGLAAVGCALLLTFGVVWGLLWYVRFEAPAPPHRVAPFASLPGNELAPTFSPDGRHIAFAWNGETGDDREFDLYVKEIGSERLLRLTHHPVKAITPAWSPDGSSIAFVRVTDVNAEIILIPALGGVERRIVGNGVAIGHLLRISWSPDGKQIAYPGYASDGSQKIFLVSLDTLQTRPLSPAPDCLDALEPAFSPDGTQLALVCTSSWGVYAIYAVRIADGSLTRVASMMGDPQGLAWTAMSDRIVFSNDTGRGGRLWQVTLNGHLSQLPFGEDGTAPALASRQGDIAYVRGQNITDIWRLDLTSAHPEQLVIKLISSSRAQLNPRYSQDGAHIVFQSNRSGSTEIWLTDGEGMGPLRLTAFNGPFTDTPSWCSDGRRIAFESSASGTSAIYIEDINERQPRRVMTSQANLSRPAWSQDCQWLFASDGKGRLYRFPFSGGAAQLFTHQSANKAAAFADRVIFSVLERSGVVLWSKRDIDAPEAPLEGMPRIGYADAWTATAAGIYYTDTSINQSRVNFYDFARRETRQLVTMRANPVPGAGFGIEVSADGHWLLYSQVDDLQSDIMLVSGS